MTVKQPDEGEIIFKDDVVVIRIETLLKWTDNFINITALRSMLARRLEKEN